MFPIKAHDHAEVVSCFLGPQVVEPCRKQKLAARCTLQPGTVDTRRSRFDVSQAATLEIDGFSFVPLERPPCKRGSLKKDEPPICDGPQAPINPGSWLAPSDRGRPPDSGVTESKGQIRLLCTKGCRQPQGGFKKPQPGVGSSVGNSWFVPGAPPPKAPPSPRHLQENIPKRNNQLTGKLQKAEGWVSQE